MQEVDPVAHAGYPAIPDPSRAYGYLEDRYRMPWRGCKLNFPRTGDAGIRRRRSIVLLFRKHPAAWLTASAVWLASNSHAALHRCEHESPGRSIAPAVPQSHGVGVYLPR